MSEKDDRSRQVSEAAAGNVPDWVVEHIRLYRESGGTRGHMWDAGPAAQGLGLLPCLLLTTKGRKSGQARTTPLIYGEVGNDIIIIGSKGGSKTHTQWYFNLLANPAAEIQVGTEHFKVRARIAAGEERAKIWAHMLTIFPVYDDYRNRTEREIPVIVLEKQ